jgi:intein/homing endonuclease
MLVYIAGKYRGDVDANIAAARKVAIELWEMGHVAICPHLNTAHFEQDCHVTDGVYLSGDLDILARCDAVVMVPGWQESVGARDEYDFAEYRGIPIYQYPDLPPLHPTEQDSPLQVRGFIDIVMKMYRTHLEKNQDYCLAPGTKVLTGDLLWVPIEEITPGTVLLGFDESASAERQFRRMYRPSVVEDVSRVHLPSYKLMLEDGTQFIASSDHPWLVSQGYTGKWVTTEHLQAQDTYTYPSKLIKVLDTWEPLHDYDNGYLAAALDGEGWLSQRPPVGKNGHKHGKGFVLGFAQRENAMLDRVLSILNKHEIAYRIKDYRKDLTQVIFSKPRRDAIRLLGETRPLRLLANLDLELGMVDLRRRIPVISKEFIGDQDLIALRTSTRTFIANGFATHNSPNNILGPGELGLMTRAWDKISRLMNLLGFHFEIKPESVRYIPPRAPKFESIEDNVRDLAVYSVNWQIYRRDLWGR